MSTSRRKLRHGTNVNVHSTQGVDDESSFVAPIGPKVHITALNPFRRKLTRFYRPPSLETSPMRPKRLFLAKRTSTLSAPLEL